MPPFQLNMRMGGLEPRGKKNATTTNKGMPPTPTKKTESYMVGIESVLSRGDESCFEVVASVSPPSDPNVGILELIDHQKWDSLMERVAEKPFLATLRIESTMASNSDETATIGSSKLMAEERGNLLLHQVCRNFPPLEVINGLLKANPSAAVVNNDIGYLPLHTACRCGASPKVIQRLLQENPQAIKMRDYNTFMMPLHLACQRECEKYFTPTKTTSSREDDEVLDLLLKQFPEAVDVHDGNWLSPADYAKKIRAMKRREKVLQLLNKSREFIPTMKATTFRLGKEFDHRLEDMKRGYREYVDTIKISHDETIQRITDALVYVKFDDKKMDLHRELEQRKDRIDALDRDFKTRIQGLALATSDNVANMVSDDDEDQKEEIVIQQQEQTQGQFEYKAAQAVALGEAANQKEKEQKQERSEKDPEGENKEREELLKETKLREMDTVLQDLKNELADIRERESVLKLQLASKTGLIDLLKSELEEKKVAFEAMREAEQKHFSNVFYQRLLEEERLTKENEALSKKIDLRDRLIQRLTTMAQAQQQKDEERIAELTLLLEEKNENNNNDSSNDCNSTNNANKKNEKAPLVVCEKE